jgi:hypothetical protein
LNVLEFFFFEVILSSPPISSFQSPNSRELGRIASSNSTWRISKDILILIDIYILIDIVAGGSVGISTAGTDVPGLGFDVVGLSVGSFRAIAGTVVSVSGAGGASEIGDIVGLDVVTSVGLNVTAEVGLNVGVFVGAISKDILILIDMDILIDIVAGGSVGISTTGTDVPGLGFDVVGLSVGSFRAITGTVVSVSGAGGASEIGDIVGLDVVAAAQSSFEAGPMPV